MFACLWVVGLVVCWTITGALREKREVDDKNAFVFDFPEITLEVLEDERAERNRRQGM